MLLPKNVIQAHLKTVATEPARHQLNGVHFSRPSSNGTIGAIQAQSTDGKVLQRTTWTEQDWKEFPTPEDSTKIEPSAELDAIVPTDSLKSIVKSCKPSPKPILDNIAAVTEDKRTTGTIEAIATDLNSVQRHTIHPIDATYPNVDSVLESLGDVTSTLKINPAHMIRCLEAIVAASGFTKAQWLSGKAKQAVTVTIHGEGKPVQMHHEARGMKTDTFCMPLVKS